MKREIILWAQLRPRDRFFVGQNGGSADLLRHSAPLANAMVFPDTAETVSFVALS